jgi:hypothetical protein
MAGIVTDPWVMDTETPPSVLGNGRAAGCTVVAGPRFSPKMVNNEPWAMEPPGSPGLIKLPPFTIPCGLITGVCARAADEKNINAVIAPNFICILPI